MKTIFKKLMLISKLEDRFVSHKNIIKELIPEPKQDGAIHATIKNMIFMVVEINAT